MNQLKAFILGVLKIAAAMLLVFVGVTVLWWGTNSLWQSWEIAKNAPLQEPKKWPPIRIKALDDVELNLSTMWRSGQLHYQFSVNGYPKTVAAVRDAAADRSSLDTRPDWTLTFFDEHGFKLFEHKIPLRAMAKIVDAKGQGTGLDANDRTNVEAGVYRRVSSWKVTWNFRMPQLAAALAPQKKYKIIPGTNIKVPKDSTAEEMEEIRLIHQNQTVPAVDRRPVGGSRPNWRSVSHWRNLKREMSKEEVRRILGEPRKVDEYGFMTKWYYGGYLSSANVSFDQSGLLKSWSEP